MRVTHKEIAARVARIVRKTCKPIRLASQSNMPGTIYRLETADESRNISPMLSPKEMQAYLEGYEKALEELWNDATDEIIGRHVKGESGMAADCASIVIGALFCPCLVCAEAREQRRRHNDRLEAERVASIGKRKKVLGPAFRDGGGAGHEEGGPVWNACHGIEDE